MYSEFIDDLCCKYLRSFPMLPVRGANATSGEARKTWQTTVTGCEKTDWSHGRHWSTDAKSLFGIWSTFLLDHLGLRRGKGLIHCRRFCQMLSCACLMCLAVPGFCHQAPADSAIQLTPPWEYKVMVGWHICVQWSSLRNLVLPPQESKKLLQQIWRQGKQNGAVRIRAPLPKGPW